MERDPNSNSSLDIQYAAREIDREPNFKIACSIYFTDRDSGKHLSDVDIGKIRGRARALLPQRQIATLMKYSKTAIQNILANYVFKTFQGRNPHRACDTYKLRIFSGHGKRGA